MQSLLLAGNPLFGANEQGIFLFGFEIYYYAICIVCGMLLAAFLSALLMKRRNMSPDFIFTLFIFCIPSALICARLFYCITAGLDITQWLNVRDGGLSIIGGVIGGVGAGFIVCLVKKIDFFRAADCVVITILLAQALGRWGNFFNKEVYGGVVASDSMKWFPFAVPVSPYSSVKGIGSFSDPSSTWHYAFFFYEMLLNLIAFAALYTAAWKWNKKPNGLFTFAYFAWYGIVRTVMEPLRDPSYILSGGGVPWSLVFSILMTVFGLGGIAVLLYLNYRKEGALVGSATGDPCGITEYLSPDKNEQPYYSKINMLGDKYPPKPEKKPTPLPPSEGGGEGSAVSPSDGGDEAAKDIDSCPPSASARHSERSEESRGTKSDSASTGGESPSPKTPSDAGDKEKKK